MNIGRITEQEWNFILIAFNAAIIKYEGIYSIKSTSFIQTIFERIKSQQASSSQSSTSFDFLVPFHESLALSLEQTENCIRKL